MRPEASHRHRETPTKRRNRSGDIRWVARYTTGGGQRRTAGTFKLKGPCRAPAEGYWSGSRWVGCCAQHAIDAAYQRERAPARPVTTLGDYAERWPKVHPRAERTNAENGWRIGVVLKIEIEGRALRDWPLDEIRRKHALVVQAELLKQRRAAEGATGVLRAVSAMINDAVDDEECGSNVWMRLGVRRTDPRVLKAPRPKRLWTMEEMHTFAAVAAEARNADREEPTELERWRNVHAEPMIRMMSDCGNRLGELLALLRTDWRLGWLRVKRTAHKSRVQAGTRRRPTISPKTNSGATCRCHRRSRRSCSVCRQGLTQRSCSQLRRGRCGGSATGAVTCGSRRKRRQGWTAGRRSSVRPGNHLLAGAGVDRADLAKYAGHSIQTANARYVQALERSAEHVRTAIG